MLPVLYEYGENGSYRSLDKKITNTIFVTVFCVTSNDHGME